MTNRQKLIKDCGKLWSELVLTRDGHQCRAKSKACWGKVDPHHIVPRTWKATVFMPDNGLSLCRHHHSHDMPDYLNNLCMGIVGKQTFLELWSVAKRGRTWKEYELEEVKVSLKQELERIKT